MPRTPLKPWWSTDHRTLIQKVDRWVSQKRRHADIGQEFEWLGWDGWVRTDSTDKPSLH